MRHQDNRFEKSFRKGSETEDRVHVRIPCMEQTHFSANRKLFEGTIKNMSHGGLYIQTRGPFQVGHEVVVAGYFEDGPREVKRYGRVVRVDSQGIGVKFIHKDPLRR